MAQEDVHLDDAGLALGLSLGGGGGASDAARQGTCSRLSREPRALEPSLTLSMPDEATATGSGGCGGGPSHSVSSLSVAGVKRERVEEADGERASSTAAAAPFYMQLPAATLTLCPSCERLGGPAAAAKADPDRPKAAASHHFFNPFTHSAAC